MMSSSQTTPKTLPSLANEANAPHAIAIWLLVCCAMVFATLIIGGVTRLTHAGLSIVEWQPLIGALPPLTDAHWQELFAKYQLTPEFRLRNHDMTLAGFQFIFWWEWAHRLSGRLIGLVFFVPYVWFFIRGQLRGQLAWKTLGFFVLGGLQGAMGWYMVQSGLVDDPRVSQYRLAAHLGLAFLIFGLMLWTALGILQPRHRAVTASPVSALCAPSETFSTTSHRTRRFGVVLIGLVFLMVLSGALVAGIHAGLAYNTFPLMNGHFLPPESFLLNPLWLNFFSNMATVQFNHRLIAWLLLGLIPWFVWRVRSESPTARPATAWLLVWLGVQVGLGISTLLLRVPVPLAAAHQAGAMILFGLVLWVNHAIRRAN
jgi:cytochrome c oxidase assembly protein subunit 15